jgi:hypothetical protein
MKSHSNLKGEDKSRAVANNISSTHMDRKSALQIADNRPSAVVQRQLQELANNSVQKKQNSSAVIQLMGDTETATITNWVLGDGRTFLTGTAPGMITDAPLSDAVRLRWFDVSIGTEKYNVGLNLHYNGGPVGGVWLKNLKTNESIEFHPKQPPQHGFDGIKDQLVKHVKDGKLLAKL